MPPGSVRPLPIPGDHSLRAGVGRWTPRAPGAGRGRAGNHKGTWSGLIEIVTVVLDPTLRMGR